MRSIISRLGAALAIAVVVLLAAASPTHAQGVWNGVVSGNNPNIRSGPSTESAVVGTLQSGSPVQVVAFVQGEMVEGINETWAEIAPGEYVYSAELSKPKPSSPPPAPRTFAGHWIDANLSEQILTAYDGSQPVFWAVMSSGAPGWETATGVHQVLRRVPNETMNSGTLAVAVPIPYDLPNVLYTQYFTSYGEAIHDNYWKGADSPYGIPTSHGCIGLVEPDALRFWNWAQTGTIVNVHY